MTLSSHFQQGLDILDQTHADTSYTEFSAAVDKAIHELTSGGEQLFVTNADPDQLWGAYLNGLPVEQRQHHNCNTCRHFLQKYARLVWIQPNGVQTSVLPALPSTNMFHRSVHVMAAIVAQAPIKDVFETSETTWGVPTTGPWHHLHAVPNRNWVKKSIASIRAQELSGVTKVADFETVARATGEFKLPHLNTAVTLLQSESLYRSEKVLGPAVWLRDLVASLPADRTLRRNLIWRAVATAPAGFCHPRSSMIGTLLDDLHDGKSLDQAARAFAAKMKPTVYQRPQAAPKAGTIEQAEKLFAQLGLAAALRRRFARMPDVLRGLLWAPSAAQTAGQGGIFGHLRAEPPVVNPGLAAGTPFTWAKFQRLVLPTAATIEVYLDYGRMPFTGTLCAADESAPPILQWDREDDRNTVSQYVYINGSAPVDWGLPVGNWAKVTGVMLSPPHWRNPDDNTHQRRDVTLLIEGCIDRRKAGLALFPETLRSELHGVRSVIEAHSRTGVIEQPEMAQANGLRVGTGTMLKLRVTNTSGVVAQYNIDRME